MAKAIKWEVGGRDRTNILLSGEPIGAAFGPHKTARVNARMMAAAPELLDAVKILVNVLDSIVKEASVAEAKKLIRRVEGRRAK